LYVGQLNERKNILRVCEAFLKASEKYSSWVLEICGQGNLRDKIPVSEKIIVNDFLQPIELAEKYQSAKVFVLGSLEEHWGVVVHEAALAGCVLILSNKVGAAPDFLTKANGALFSPMSVDSITAAMEEVMQWTPKQFDMAQEKTLELSQRFGGDVFADNVLKLVRKLGVSRL
jgi:glycosyltransferase involved in cell wall biosynthesis